MSALPPPTAERVLVLAPRGRDAVVAKGILREAYIAAQICLDLGELMTQIHDGADAVVLTEEAVRSSDARALHDWWPSNRPGPISPSLY